MKKHLKIFMTGILSAVTIVSAATVVFADNAFPAYKAGGWQKDPKGWWYLNPDGSYPYNSWNWIDGKCYYMDQKNGHMLAGCMTPDGYTVDDTGAWCVHGVVQTFGKK